MREGVARLSAWRRTVVVGVVGVLAAALWAATMVPAQAADHDPPVLTPTRDGVAVVAVDGARRILDPDGADGAWSPDGERVAYVARPTLHGRFSELRVIGRDGSGRRTLAPSEADVVLTEPAWSSDGRLAYVEHRHPDSRVVVRAEDGRRLAVSRPPTGAKDRAPTWADDGTLAFIREPVGAFSFRTFASRLWTLDVAGREQELVGGGRVRGRADWSPDGTRLAYPAGRSVEVVDRAGRQVASVTAPDARHVAEPVFSPDGRSLAFGTFTPWTAGAVDGEPSTLVVADLASGGVRSVADTPMQEFGVDWSPDGLRLVVTDRQNDSGCHCWTWSLHVVGADGAGLRELDGFVFASSDHARMARPAFGPGVVRRLAGPTRVETAVMVSRERFASARTVVLARADAYADALAGGPLAAEADGPLLLTSSQRLDPAVAAELTRLGARRVLLLGGERALSRGVAAALESAGLDVERIAGADRFDTARLAARRLPGARRGWIVEGIHADPRRGWPDAVAVSAFAAQRGEPILLVTHDRLPEATRAALADLPAATVVGGPAAVSQAVMDAVGAAGPTVDRVSGDDRYGTSARIADRALAAGATLDTVWFARGDDWPDSLSAGPAAAAAGGILLLVDRADLRRAPPVHDWLRARATDLGDLRLVGGPDVVAPTVAVQLERLAGGAPVAPTAGGSLAAP